MPYNHDKDYNKKHIREALAEHFQLESKHIRCHDRNHTEEWSLNFQSMGYDKLINHWHSIEVCHPESQTTEDLGEDAYSHLIHSIYVWRWL